MLDISIWLHQLVKGFQDSKGSALPHAHLLGLFHRLCKLLFYRIKPVFVFDGGVPPLKRQTIAKRAQSKSKYQNEAERIQQLLLQSLAKEKIVQQALGASANLLVSPTKKVTPTKEEKDDLFKLPPVKNEESLENLAGTELSQSESSPDSSFDEPSSRNYFKSLHSIDVKSSNFKNLPPDVRLEILTDIKELRKQSSWGRLHELPVESNDFSSFQMGRLLKRRQVQVSLEEAEAEVGGKCLSMGELEQLLKEEGVQVDSDIGVSRKIASDENTRFLLVRDLKKAEQNQEGPSKPKSMKIEDPGEGTSKNFTSNESIVDQAQAEYGEEYVNELQRAIELSLQVNDLDSDSEELLDDFRISEAPVKLTDNQKKVLSGPAMSLARDYMIEYAGMSHEDVVDLLGVGEGGSKVKLDDENKFKYNDSFILKGKKIDDVKQTPASVIVLSDDDDAVVETDIQKVISDSESDSDFIDVPDDFKSPHMKVFPVLPIIANQNDSSDTRKDFRLEDLELVIDPNKNNSDEDDLFADVFAPKQPSSTLTKVETPLFENPKLNDILKNLEEAKKDVLKIDLDSILIISPTEGSVISVADTDATIVDESLMVIKETLKDSKVIEILDDESTNRYTLAKKEIKQTEILNFFQRTPPKEVGADVFKTPTKSKKKEEDVPKVVSPFFVKRSPKSQSKITPEKLQNGKIVAKTLFPSITELEKKVEEAREEVVKKAAISLKDQKSKEELEDIAVSLANEKRELETERNKQGRMGVSITDQMSRECMELLRIFGIPYIIAPMEAEAQCAFLNQIELTDGTITDDSDIWLFGGRTVYKNFFNLKKHVMEFNIENVEKLYNVDRNKLIQLAMLVGSDYTTGVNGVGAVTALEIIATFPSTLEKEGQTNVSMSILSSLRKFRDWIVGGRAVGPSGRTALRSKLKNITLSEGFPFPNVVQAYLHPTVDSSKEKFVWGVPDAETIREFTKKTFGWTALKTDELLLPVLKRLDEKKAQQSIKNYFKTQTTVNAQELKVSKRVHRAIQKMSGTPEDELESTTNQSPKKSKRIKKIPLTSTSTLASQIQKSKTPSKVKVTPAPIDTVKKSDLLSRINSISSAMGGLVTQPSTSSQSNRGPRIPNTNLPIPQREMDEKLMKETKQKAINLFKKKQQNK